LPLRARHKVFPERNILTLPITTLYNSEASADNCTSTGAGRQRSKGGSIIGAWTSPLRASLEVCFEKIGKHFKTERCHVLVDTLPTQRSVPTSAQQERKVDSNHVIFMSWTLSPPISLMEPGYIRSDPLANLPSILFTQSVLTVSFWFPSRRVMKA